MAVLDANGDGLDDIAIGAPLHTELMDNYEAGRVYVVYQNEDVSLMSGEKHSKNSMYYACTNIFLRKLPKKKLINLTSLQTMFDFD